MEGGPLIVYLVIVKDKPVRESRLRPVDPTHNSCNQSPLAAQSKSIVQTQRAARQKFILAILQLIGSPLQTAIHFNTDLRTGLGDDGGKTRG